MTIFDVPNIEEAVAWERVRATLERHPVLKRIYDDAALAEIVRQRQPNKNHQLFWLVLPTDDERSINFWSSVTDDLTVLEPFAAVEKFRDKMRQKEREYFESWRTELWLAAWLVRNGISLTLEPAVGEKHPEFVTATTPPTWWEAKTPLDPKLITDDEAVLAEIQHRLREIPEPFVLILKSADLRMQSVAAAVRGIKAQVKKFAERGTEPPMTIECDGLLVEITSRRTKATGTLGAFTSSGYLFGNPYRTDGKDAAEDVKNLMKALAGVTVLDAPLSEKILDKINSAIKQLPEDGGGVVVIDRTLSDWADNTDVLNACFGEDVLVSRGDGKLIACRENGFFRPNAGTRVSAVVSFSRHPMYWERGYEMEIYHNPYAKVPIPEDMFRFPGVKHVRRAANPDGSFSLKETGDTEPG